MVQRLIDEKGFGWSIRAAAFLILVRRFTPNVTPMVHIQEFATSQIVFLDNSLGNNPSIMS